VFRTLLVCWSGFVDDGELVCTARGVVGFIGVVGVIVVACVVLARGGGSASSGRSTKSSYALVIKNEFRHRFLC